MPLVRIDIVKGKSKEYKKTIIASWKTVEKCDGVLENTVHVAGDDEAIRRYWIELN